MAEMHVYGDANLGGQNGIFNQSLPNVLDIWNDKITSAKVISGTWEVYEDTDYKGRSITLVPGDYANLAVSPGGIENDSITSVRVVSN